MKKRINYLMGYDNKIKLVVKEQSILDFHLSHKTNPQFKFEPKNTTSKQIWRYLSTSNLLDDLNNIDLDDENKICQDVFKENLIIFILKENYLTFIKDSNLI